MSWRNHRHRGYSVEVKVYEFPSSMGIRKGRVSKLRLKNKAGKLVANYDRGWDIRPSKKIHRSIINWVLRKYKKKRRM